MATQTPSLSSLFCHTVFFYNSLCVDPFSLLAPLTRSGVQLDTAQAGIRVETTIQCSFSSHTRGRKKRKARHPFCGPKKKKKKVKHRAARARRSAQGQSINYTTTDPLGGRGWSSTCIVGCTWCAGTNAGPWQPCPLCYTRGSVRSRGVPLASEKNTLCTLCTRTGKEAPLGPLSLAGAGRVLRVSAARNL